MTAFRYEAARADGALVRGVIEADSRSAATALLSSRELFPVAVEPDRTGWSHQRRPSARAQATLFQSLASLVGAGIPLEQALRAAESVTTGRLREAMVHTKSRVREGASLGAALAAEGLFSGVTIGLIRAGERGVGLGAALEQAAAQLEREAETLARIRGALAYPLLLATVGAVSVGVIVLFVVPKFVALLADLEQSLPLATRLLVATSELARRFGIPLLGLTAAGVIGGLRLVRERRTAWHVWLLRLPLLGAIRHALATARTSRTLAALLGSGTPALAALAIAQEASGDGAVAERLARARDQVAEGVALSAALSATGALTATALQLAAIGERSGSLPSLLAKAAELEEREAERRLKTLVTFLEPALILAFAGLVAFVAAALLQAVYSLRPGGP